MARIPLVDHVARVERHLRDENDLDRLLDDISERRLPAHVDGEPPETYPSGM